MVVQKNENESLNQSIVELQKIKDKKENEQKLKEQKILNLKLIDENRYYKEQITDLKKELVNFEDRIVQMDNSSCYDPYPVKYQK